MSLRAAPEKMILVGTDSNEYYLNLAVTDSRHLVPRAKDPAYIDRLNEIIHKEKVEFLHAQPDVEVEVVSENREKLDAQVFLPSKTAVTACQDKLESAKVWHKKGVPVARTLEIRDESDLEKAFEEFGNPIWVRARHGAGGKGSTPAYNK